jgi:hypothetical protein
MKHILNNLSEQEKNAIREQHTGGMNVVTENFHKLLGSKLGDSKPLTEQLSMIGKAASAITGQGNPVNQYKKPPYCKIGQSQGTIVNAQTGTSGPDTSLGETGLALSLNGKEVCLISTKYPQGGYVTGATTVAKTQNSALPPPDKNLKRQQQMAGQKADGLRQGDPRKG